MDTKNLQRRFADYCELTKPRLMSFAMMTVMVGLIMSSPNAVNLTLLVHVVFGVGLCACSAGIMNQVLERDLDAKMERTRCRPLPSGRLSMAEACIVGSGCAGVGVVYLGVLVNVLTAMIGLSIVVIYLFVYTPLKTRTSFNTFAGAFCGALPPVMGCTAVDNALTPTAYFLFAIVFIWQLPHFLSLAWLYREDYERAGMKMLSVLDPDGRITTQQILLYSIVMLPVSLLPAEMGQAGLEYCFATVSVGLVFLSFVLYLKMKKSKEVARIVFLASLVYLPTLLSFMVLDKLVFS